MFIDSPGVQAGELRGTVTFAGWAIDANEAISSVTVLIDGVAIGNATYGNTRSDVCAAYPGVQNCPNVGWNLSVDTTVLANGLHSVEVTGTSAGGLHNKGASTFVVAN